MTRTRAIIDPPAVTRSFRKKSVCDHVACSARRDRGLRRQRLAPICFVFLLLVPSAAPKPAQKPVQFRSAALPSKEKRFALLIGVGTYENSIKPLKGPTNDVGALKNALIKYAGFSPGNIFTLSSDNTDPHEKPTVTNIVRLLGQELKPKLAGGLLLVAFSGHGINKIFREGSHIQHVPLLLMYDSSLSPDYLLQQYALPVSKLRALLETADASQVILFVDACQDDPDPSKTLADNPMTEQFASALQLRSQRLDGSLLFFATRPPLRAYVSPRDRGYFTEAVVEALQGAADKDQKNYTTLDTFIGYVHALVLSETKGKQNPEEDHNGYDLQKVRIVDRADDITSSPGTWHNIVVRHTGTESACATLPSDTKLLVTVGRETSSVESALGCKVRYFLPDSIAGSVANINLASARGVLVDNGSSAQDRGAATWTVDVHYSGPAIRLSQFDLKLGSLSGAGFDYRRVLNEQVLLLGGLLSTQAGMGYTNRLTVVETGREAKPPLADQMAYLEGTNSVELLWGEGVPGATGNPELHVHVLVRPQASISGLVTAKFILSDSATAYQNVSEVTKALILLGLLEDARSRNDSQAVRVLGNRLLQILEGTTGLENVSSDLVSIRGALEIEQRSSP